LSIREAPAYIFELIQRDAAKSRTLIVDLEAVNTHLEPNLTNVVDNATEGVSTTQQTA
jgi:hypothetical protein